MDTVVNGAILSPEIKTRVHATDLLSVLDQYGEKIKVLSLDCFDTILWRKTVAPIDVFYDLQQRPTFQALGFSASLRITAETNARRLKVIQVDKH